MNDPRRLLIPKGDGAVQGAGERGDHDGPRRRVGRRELPRIEGSPVGPSRFAAAPVPAEVDRDDDRDRDEDVALAPRVGLHETLGAMGLAAALGVASERDADEVQELGVKLKKMLRALLR